MVRAKASTISGLCFAEYLQPSERSDLVRVFIEATTDSSTFDKEAARSVLDMAKGNPDLWLVDEVVTTLLQVAPGGDSTALALWEVMFSVPQTVRSILRELLSQLWDLKSRLFCTHLEDYCLVRLAMLASRDLGDRTFAATYLDFRFLKEERPAMLSLVLRGIMTLSETVEMARKMKIILPDLMRVLLFGYKAATTKALLVFRTVMAQLERKEASHVAVQMAEFLLPLLDDELSQLRESSISLFRDLMKMAVGNDKREMKNVVRLGLLPLFFRMSDQTQSVAKAAGEALLAAAELLKWKPLKHLVRTQQTWQIGESLPQPHRAPGWDMGMAGAGRGMAGSGSRDWSSQLGMDSDVPIPLCSLQLKQDSSRAQEFLIQSLSYLKDAQASLREAAVRFIGLAARHLTNPSQRKLAEICSALQTLAEDSEPSIRSLVVQTVIIILSSPREQPRPRWTLRALCCR
ncbi:maestro heat-like repeat-containing protein family member 7 [Patagioenas fasciata]|uniref:maestro heat-like repeat-containing protein family member 7 n=1 Tax=Patagioenas fasciata TaxID=372321 RepID=UPI003A999859